MRKLTPCYIVFFLTFISCCSALPLGWATSASAGEFLRIKSTTALMRKGPGLEFPKIWEYKSQGLPMRVLARLDNWIRVIDWRGETGWMHRSLLSSGAGVIVTAQALTMSRYARPDSSIHALIMQGAVLTVSDCLPKWCHVLHPMASGWVLRSGLWGNLDP